MPGKGTEQTVATGRGESVGASPELGVKIEDVLRQRPVKCQVAATLGTGIVGNEETVTTGWIGWPIQLPYLVVPQSQQSVRAEFPRHQADHLGVFT